MRQLLFLILVVLGCNVLHAQSLQKPVTDAYLVSRMVEKYHIQPRPLDDERSDAILPRSDDGARRTTYFLYAGGCKKTGRIPPSDR